MCIRDRRGPEPNWNRQIEFPNPDGSTQTLLLHGTRLPDDTGGGWVVVFDDITHLIAAQRTAAWAEVARRLAHEIKNPVSYTHLDVYKRQMPHEVHQSWPQRCPGGGSSVTRKGTKRKRSGTGSFSSG